MASFFPAKVAEGAELCNTQSSSSFICLFFQDRQTQEYVLLALYIIRIIVLTCVFDFVYIQSTVYTLHL